MLNAYLCLYRSKGYSCCKKRVLEFDQFLTLEGCKRSRHMFVGPLKDESVRLSIA